MSKTKLYFLYWQTEGKKPMLIQYFSTRERAEHEQEVYQHLKHDGVFYIREDTVANYLKGLKNEKKETSQTTN